MVVGGSVKMKAARGGELQDEATCLDSRMRENPARNRFTGACRIIHHIPWQYHAEIYPHGYHVYIKVQGQWRLYRVCEACHNVYL